MLELTHRAMACDFVVLIPDESLSVQGTPVADVALEALEQVDEVESRLTVYQHTSEISRVNAEASNGPVRVSRKTFDLIAEGIALAERLAGSFDITAGPLVDAWGFSNQNGKKPSSKSIDQARMLVGWQQLVLNQGECSVHFRQPGMKINLGAIGKGHAIDQLASRLRSHGIHDFLIHAGQSSVLASGNQLLGEAMPRGLQESQGDEEELEPPEGWLVGIAHPTKPNRRLGGIWLHNAALGTSGSGKQFFHHRGRRMGHVMDPRTGYPAGDLLSLSVQTKTATEADALATGLFVMGQESSQRFAHEAELPLITIADAGRQDAVTIDQVGSWRWEDPPPNMQLRTIGETRSIDQNPTDINHSN